MARIVVFLMLVLLPSIVWAQAEARLALLIGNQAYNAKVGPLTNPHRDVALVAAALEKTRFKTTIIRDGDYRSIDAAIKRHIAAVREGAIVAVPDDRGLEPGFLQSSGDKRDITVGIGERPDLGVVGLIADQ